MGFPCVLVRRTRMYTVEACVESTCGCFGRVILLRKGYLRIPRCPCKHGKVTGHLWGGLGVRNLDGENSRIGA